MLFNWRLQKSRNTVYIIPCESTWEQVADLLSHHKYFLQNRIISNHKNQRIDIDILILLPQSPQIPVKFFQFSQCLLQQKHPIQSYTLYYTLFRITHYCHVSLVSFNLEQFLRFSLTFMSNNFENYRMSFHTCLTFRYDYDQYASLAGTL